MAINLFLGENTQSVQPDQAIAFFGEQGFGDNIPIGEYNKRTFVSTSGGQTEIYEADNNQFLNSSGVIIGQIGTGILLSELPNFLATLNVRFTNVTPVRVQNTLLTVHTGDGITAPVGIEILGAEIQHTDLAQTDTGVGDQNWLDIAGSGNSLGLIDSPGTSGFRPFGPATTDIRHDWYVAMTVKPTSPNDKSFKITVQLEFL